MLEGLIKLYLAISKLPPRWRLFAYLVVVLNGVMPLLYLDNKMARAVWRTFALTVVVMAGLTKRFGFTRLVGVAQWVSLPLGDHRGRFIIIEEASSGPLVALMGGRLDRQMPALYRAMYQGLKQQVEDQTFEKGKRL